MEASELFALYQELASRPPSADATRRLHTLLVMVCSEGCRQQGGAFGNVFSQIDFLGRHLGLRDCEIRDIQTARRHSNSRTAIGADDWLYDVKAVARLTSSVFKEDVPGSLLCLLPADERPHTRGLRINKTYLRCIVSSIDQQFIHADTGDGAVAIDYTNTDSGRDFAYLRKLVRPGMQLNLLDSNINADETVVVPGQVIVEPDFLIDISSIAACFTNYGHHPLLYTLNRLKQQANTQATLLGNFAGTALDDIVSHPAEATTAASLHRSFREQALKICACSDFDPAKFKMQADEQMEHIRQAVTMLRASTPSSPFLLEPSFVCEHLGLQGRVDLMTADMSLLVEQKAGKNMKIEYQSHDSHGLQLESHYVQLLLYYGVLRYNFGLSDRQVSTRLLYSRYPATQGLLTVNYYRTLLREALMLRNQIVATELHIARQGFGRIVPLLNVDTIYKGIACDGYFHRYVQPVVDGYSQLLAAATPLERAYYERMLTFVYREQVAQKLGSSDARLHHSGGCTSDLWLMPLPEKIETGNIIMGLSVIGRERSDAAAGFDLITLIPAGDASLLKPNGEAVASPPDSEAAEDSASSGFPAGVAPPNFRPGDMVFLYSYTDTPDVCHSILFKGTLQQLSTTGIVVILNNGQQDADIFDAADGRHWAIEHGSSDTGTSSSLRALQGFISATPSRRALLLGQRDPVADTHLQLSRPYHPSYDDVLTAIRQSRDYFLLVGPPGTGKTSMALRFIVEEELSTASPQPAILLTAYTNRAVDEICAMLCDAGLPFLRMGRAASCAPRFHEHLLDTALANTPKLSQARQLIERTPIIVATTSMVQAQPFVLEVKHFTLAVVDEASQLLEPSIIGLLADESIDRFVLIGDHKQLPAVVQQEAGQTIVNDECLLRIGLDDCRRSLFERLLRWEQRKGRTQFTGILHSHGRMHPDVAAFPLAHFYQHEQLSPVPLPHQKEQQIGYGQNASDTTDRLLQTRRMVFLPVEACSDADIKEAQLAASVLSSIYRFTEDHFDPSMTVGIIVTYRRQIALIRQCIAAYGCLATVSDAISIDTVERYQGSQRDVIIYTTGVSHRYEMDFLTATTFYDANGQLIDRKLNVALTRARRQTIVIGQADVLRTAPLYRQLIEQYG